jgi:hypothetical protein
MEFFRKQVDGLTKLSQSVISLLELNLNLKAKGQIEVEKKTFTGVSCKS